MMSIPTTSLATATENPFCGICQEEISSAEERLVLACNHLWHKSCLAQWLAVAPTCPVCRKQVSWSDMGSGTLLSRVHLQMVEAIALLLCIAAYVCFWHFRSPNSLGLVPPFHPDYYKDGINSDSIELFIIIFLTAWWLCWMVRDNAISE